ncbi:metal-dependent hydrolase [Pseudalkalibacillus caeni]|uniref:Metal-dependent hydrolase n=1 Tax=Exobacillus caeni TaxID=2574798 RepID=A0A5R9EZQ7_9BACL|nr:metal-dependent hydrolase [Pseudalkalibacillus caeni]TLS36832.1 metal-dependent hydrolase [Pseudalkalibacillus caeni]
MEGKTHLLGGICIGSVVHYYSFGTSLEISQSFLLIGSSLVGSILPDICHPGSTAGRKTKALSKRIAAFFGHRTVTHSLFFLFFVNWLVSYLPLASNDVVQNGILAGMISHYILDALTVRGIKLFYPLPIRVRFPIFIKTGSSKEGFVLSGLSIVSLWYLYVLFI